MWPFKEATMRSSVDLHAERAFFMTAATQIYPDKFRAYLAANYQISHTSQYIVLTIGQRWDALLQLILLR
jgi:hypothetical protein